MTDVEKARVLVESVLVAVRGWRGPQTVVSVPGVEGVEARLGEAAALLRGSVGLSPEVEEFARRVEARKRSRMDGEWRGRGWEKTGAGLHLAWARLGDAAALSPPRPELVRELAAESGFWAMAAASLPGGGDGERGAESGPAGAGTVAAEMESVLERGMVPGVGMIRGWQATVRALAREAGSGDVNSLELHEEMTRVQESAREMEAERDEAWEYGDAMRAKGRVAESWGEAASAAMETLVGLVREGDGEESIWDAVGEARDRGRIWRAVAAGAKPLMKIMCSFCRGVVTDADMADHMRGCEKHPLAAATAEAESLRRRVTELESALKAADTWICESPLTGIVPIRRVIGEAMGWIGKVSGSGGGSPGVETGEEAVTPAASPAGGSGRCRCEQPLVYFNPDHDNYYCGGCRAGMGTAYYVAARKRDHLVEALAAVKARVTAVESELAESMARKEADTARVVDAVTRVERERGEAESERLRARVQELEARFAGVDGIAEIGAGVGVGAGAETVSIHTVTRGRDGNVVGERMLHRAADPGEGNGIWTVTETGGEAEPFVVEKTEAPDSGALIRELSETYAFVAPELRPETVRTVRVEFLAAVSGAWMRSREEAESATRLGREHVRRAAALESERDRALAVVADQERRITGLEERLRRELNRVEDVDAQAAAIRGAAIRVHTALSALERDFEGYPADVDSAVSALEEALDAEPGRDHPLLNRVEDVEAQAAAMRRVLAEYREIEASGALGGTTSWIAGKVAAVDRVLAGDAGRVLADTVARLAQERDAAETGRKAAESRADALREEVAETRRERDLAQADARQTREIAKDLGEAQTQARVESEAAAQDRITELEAQLKGAAGVDVMRCEDAQRLKQETVRLRGQVRVMREAVDGIRDGLARPCCAEDRRTILEAMDACTAALAESAPDDPRGRDQELVEQTAGDESPEIETGPRLAEPDPEKDAELRRRDHRGWQQRALDSRLVEKGWIPPRVVDMVRKYFDAVLTAARTPPGLTPGVVDGLTRWIPSGAGETGGGER